MAEVPHEQIEIDGREIDFFPLAEGNYRLEDSGKVLGRLELVEGRSFHVLTASGERLTQSSVWGGSVSARFSTRELAARALLAVARQADG